jgi:hypothetical protein
MIELVALLTTSYNYHADVTYGFFDSKELIA